MLPNREKLGLLLRKAYIQSSAAVDDALRPLNLGMRHYSVLCQLSNQSHKLNQKELSEQTTLAQTRLVDLLDDLEGRSLIERSENPQDRRSHVLTITPRGEKVFYKATDLVKGAHTYLYGNFSGEDKEKFLALLNRFLGNE